MTNLKRIIDEKGIQQRWLAEQVGVTEGSMSRYVNGERIPKAPMAIRMADVLGVDVKELYGWDDKHVVGEPEQPETHSVCLDTISRQAAIDEAKEWIDAVYFEENDKRERKAIECVIGSLKNIQSAQPEKVCIANITLSEEQILEAVEKAKNEVVRVLLDEQPTADVVEADKAQKEIDYWHDKAQSYEQTILKLSLNKAEDAVEVVRCKDCKKREHCRTTNTWAVAPSDDWFCADGERA